MRSHITKEAYRLGKALRYRGIKLELEHWDGHKHVDIFIPSAQLCIEVDGLQHFTSANQILADLERAHYSDNDGLRTMHIPNEVITTHFDKVVNAIEKVIKIRSEQASS
jgi:very-short-patch-repair endonuclease